MSYTTEHPEIAFTMATGLKRRPVHKMRYFECECGENVYSGDKYYELSYKNKQGQQITETFCEECKDELFDRYIELHKEEILKEYEKTF